MSTVLKLQKLVPLAGQDEMNAVLVSTYSSICPTNGVAGEGTLFQME